jgi:hypothetical protein
MTDPSGAAAIVAWLEPAYRAIPRIAILHNIAILARNGQKLSLSFNLLLMWKTATLSSFSGERMLEFMAPPVGAAS